MKKDSLKVSICMATYNGAQFVKSQMESFMHQLGDNDEIIVSDDGSTDDTITIIQAFNDNRIKIINNRLPSGPVGNFQNSILNATGDVIFLCDQDDIWFENKIERHLLFHREHDLVVSNAVVIDEAKTVLFKSFFLQRGSKSGLMNNLKRNSYIGCCMSFNRKILEAALPFPKDIHMHDWWIGLVSEVKGSIFFLKEPLMYYIRHDNNASGTLVKTLPFNKQLHNRVIMMKNILLLFIRNFSKSKTKQ